jgi:hypothetical protein
MAGTLKRLAGPAFLQSTSENLYVPSAATIYGEVRHMHFASNAARAISVWLGATGAEVTSTALFVALPIAANATYDYYCLLKQVSTDFLVGLSSVDATSVTYVIEGYEYVV